MTHYKDMTPKQRKAADATIADATLQHPRAIELRAQKLESMESSLDLTKLSRSELAMLHENASAVLAVCNITESTDGTSPAAEAAIRVAIPTVIGPKTDAGDLRLALMSQFRIRGAEPVVGIPVPVQ